ncbi:hypothetical protein BIV57_14015 [Mangrovactinospora gilvigrisea]|uniref:Cytoskeleton protein RodZ-like C-terminal domain-containing protein n=1 Tax=Mangrovactinospora gilvigrisea TaxID=1428644 RepID=A0A1J7BDX9_9ACTN|nr:hypothetical protein BIV57_14015 [Mangrovactinospora gilvigrisea]
MARARADAGLTVDQVGQATSIRAPLILAIEQDDYSLCGGGVYARGHIRAIAHAVGADGDALVAQYDDEHGGAPSLAGPMQLFEKEGIRPERRRPNWAAAMVAAIVAVVAFVGISLVNGHGGKTGGSGTQAAQVRTPSARPASHPAKPSPTPSRSAVAAAPADRVTVTLTSSDSDKSWVQVTDSQGNTVYRQVLDSGRTKTFTDPDELKVMLGNAGAVKLTVNGKELGTAGSAGQIRRLDFTKGNPTLG